MEQFYLTGVIDLDWLNLIDTDYKTLLSTCIVNRAINMICQNDQFWKARVDHDFPGASQLKPVRETFRQQYDFLYRLPSILTLTSSSSYSRRDDAIISLINNGTQIDTNVLTQLIRQGRLSILQALYQQGYRFNHKSLLIAAGSGHLPVVEWFISIGVQPTQDIVDEAAANDNILLLDWFEQRGLLPGKNGLYLAAQSCSLEALDWMEARNILPDENIANAAIEFACLRVLDWMEDRGILPTQEGIDMAFQSGDTDVIYWMLNRGFSPSYQDEEFDD